MVSTTSYKEASNVFRVLIFFSCIIGALSFPSLIFYDLLQLYEDRLNGKSELAPYFSQRKHLRDEGFWVVTTV